MVLQSHDAPCTLLPTVVRQSVVALLWREWSRTTFKKEGERERGKRGKKERKKERRKGREKQS